jgi:hypothetical protein
VHAVLGKDQHVHSGLLPTLATAHWQHSFNTATGNTTHTQYAPTAKPIAAAQKAIKAACSKSTRCCMSIPAESIGHAHCRPTNKPCCCMLHACIASACGMPSPDCGIHRHVRKCTLRAQGNRTKLTSKNITLPRWLCPVCCTWA